MGGASFEDELAAISSGFGADFDDVVGVTDDIELVLDDEEGVSGIDEAVEDGEEAGDVSEVESGGRFVEDEEGIDAALGADEKLAEFEALGLAAGEGIEGLAEAEVAKSGVY